ncbi:GTP-binding protein 10-like [Mizuhopecten yessoensis]|uniref:GTP-binding protein 10-like n=2 Tax=Mizuhopecten yessoensis TaxID=6573 RepID=A0A210QQN5_MIZYE|nr:GTP-binding protein 10-like [Mizuhopecten yessoensis]
MFALAIRMYSTKAAPKNTRPRKTTFIDSLRLHVRGGSGGQGIQKFGGSGGDGGCVYVKANKDIENLHTVLESNPKKRYVAEVGQDSRKHWILGNSGEDICIEVPLGVSVKDQDGKEIADLDEHDQEVVVAEGGNGGTERNNFLGLRGQARTIVLDLKLIADVALVGFPNAGKSTTLSAVSRTSPKIASYPFTTIRPYIGTMEYPDLRQITVADLPGLIEGAHINKGMGHKFLKHIERTKLLLFIIDIDGFQLHNRYNYRSAFETILLLNKELELYNREVLEKPAILALNKIDLDHDNEKTNTLIQQVKGLPESLSAVDSELHPEQLIKFDGILKMSAKNRDSVEMVKDRIRKRLDFHHEKERRLKEKHGICLPENSKGLQERLKLKNEQSKSRLL